MERIQFGRRQVAGFGFGVAPIWVALEAPFRLVKNTRYRATLNLPWYATDALVTEKLASVGFTNVTIDSPNKRAEGTWSKDDQTVTLPDEVTAVWRLESSPSDSVTPPSSEPPALPEPPPAPSEPSTPSEPPSTSSEPPASRQQLSFTRETPLPMTQEQRQTAIDAWSASSGYAKVTLPDGTAGFKGPSGDLLQANGMPYVLPAPFNPLEWIRAHQTPIAIGAVVVGSAIVYKLVRPVAYATA